MILAALAAFALAALVALGRRPLFARAYAKIVALGLTLAAAGAGLLEIVRGGWEAGVILLLASAWLGGSLYRTLPPPAAKGMGRAEAASMLGVDEAADREQIEAAFRRLIVRVHPDQGGAAGLAAQLNAARAVLLVGKR